MTAPTVAVDAAPPAVELTVVHYVCLCSEFVGTCGVDLRGVPLLPPRAVVAPEQECVVCVGLFGTRCRRCGEAL